MQKQLAYTLAKPLTGEYAIILSTNERASEVIDQFKSAGADKHFIGVIDAITKVRHRRFAIPGDSCLSQTRPISPGSGSNSRI